jgi:hypothetical protein
MALFWGAVKHFQQSFDGHGYGVFWVGVDQTTDRAGVGCLEWFSAFDRPFL